MIDVRTLSDKDLIDYINKAEQSTNQIFNKAFDRAKDKYLNPEIELLYDMDEIRNKEKYNQLLSLVIRMGLPTKNENTVIPISGLPTRDKDRLVIHMLLLEEARRRHKNIHDKEVRFKAYDKPEKISDVPQVLDFGNQINLLSSINRFDYPVRQACIVLFSKGYVPYWSSANKMDINERTGLIAKGKNVAYILIDPENIPSRLKGELLLDGTCEFAGAALDHSEDGNYYGIWEEIVSSDMGCDDLSKRLLEKAIALPDLFKENRITDNQEKDNGIKHSK